MDETQVGNPDMPGNASTRSKRSAAGQETTMDQTVERPKVEMPAITSIEETLGLDARGRNHERRRKWALWSTILLLALAGIGIWQWFDQAPAKIVYTTEAAAARDLTIKVSATGTLQPLTQVDVSSELSGVVRSVSVEENQEVKKGDVLAVLDKTRIQAQIEGAKASVLAAKAQVEQADTTLADTSRTLDRTKQLAAKGMAATQALDTATADRDRAAAALSVAKANVAVAQANEKLQETDLDKSTIYAPIDGVVLTRSVDPGQTVASSFSAPVLFVIAQDLKSMQLEAAIDEADIGKVAKGQTGHFTVDAFPEQRFDAKISDIAFASVTTDNVVTYQAKLDVDNSKLLLRPGMTAAVDIVTRQANGVLTVPNAAFRYSPPAPQAGSSRGFNLRDLFMPRFRGRRDRAEPPATTEGLRAVYVLRDDHPRKVMVKPGDTDGQFTEILSGLKEGDQVITASSRQGS
jgi:HlyD family secretion protein